MSDGVFKYTKAGKPAWGIGLTNNSPMAYQWKSPFAWSIVVVNLSSLASQGSLHFSDPTRMLHCGSQTCLFVDKLTDQEYTHSYNDLIHHGLYVCLKPFGANVFAISSP